MTLQEIKKEYQKMSRQLKKQNLNYTCVMNAKQQRLGTATICFFSSLTVFIIYLRKYKIY